MTSRTKSHFLRTTALGLTGTIAALTAAQVQAASVSNFTVNNVQSVAGQCAVEFSFSWSFTRADTLAADTILSSIASSSGGSIVSGTSAQHSLFSGSQNVTRTVNLAPTIPPNFQYHVAVHDRFTGPGGNPGQLISAIPITTAALQQAGGACLGLIPNVAPVANAGADQNGRPGETITLDGSASIDADNDPLTYSWAPLSGAPALTNPTSANPSFVAPPVGGLVSYAYTLTVSDGFRTSTDTVQVNVRPNAVPIVNAGADFSATGNSQVTLNGTATDADNDPLTIQWAQIGGTPVVLTGANTLTPSFTAPAPTAAAQTLLFRLSANDGFVTSNADIVTVTIPNNAAPIVNAGSDQTVDGGSQVSLGGTASDPDNDSLTYSWIQTSGPPVTLTSGTGLAPTFTAPPRSSTAQILTFDLVADDGRGGVTSDSVEITVRPNQDPTADAGPDQTVRGGSTVVLDAGLSSDPENDTLTYSWTQLSGPVVALSNPASANPSFIAPAGGAAAQTIVFEVTVSDGFTASGTTVRDTVTITVEPNSPPVADAGPDQGPINTGSTVTLDGSGSSDPDNDALTYIWTQVSGPAVTLTGATTASPSFTAPDVQGTQNLVFQLVVNDGTADSAPDTVTIAVRAVGSVTIIQRVIGDDRSFSFTSDIGALNGSLTTSAGIGQLFASLVPAGSHTLSAADLSGAGYALTDISCNDSDSTVNLTNRSVAIVLSPNENLVCTFTSADTRSAASSAIADFLTARNAALLTQQPDLQRRLDRLNGNPSSNSGVVAHGIPVPKSALLPVSLNIGSTGMQASTSLSRAARAVEGPGGSDRAFDIWAEAYLSRLSYGAHRGNLSVIYAGMDYRFGTDLLAGVMVGFDDFSRRGAITAGAAEGNGWMAGPYVMARISPDLYIDARAAWGKSDNTVSPLGTFNDGFDTNRAYYSGSLVGEFGLGSAATIRPEVTVRYLREGQQAYVDSLGVTVPAQVVDQGDISFRPRLYYTTGIGDGWNLRPYGEAEGILTFGLPDASLLGDSFRMRIEGGLELMSDTGMRIGVGGFYDGIGAARYEAKGAHVSVSFGF